MKLMTKEIEKMFKKQGDTSRKKAEDIKIIAKYFSCVNGWTWFVYEYDIGTNVFMGYVEGYEKELGSFSLTEFEEINKSKGFAVIERDYYFGFDKTLKEVMG